MLLKSQQLSGSNGAVKITNVNWIIKTCKYTRNLWDHLLWPQVIWGQSSQLIEPEDAASGYILTFGQMFPKLNSRLVYCSQLYGTSILVYSLLDKIWISGTALIYSNKKNSQFLCPKGKNCKPVEIKLLLFVGHMVILGRTLILRYIQSLTSKLNSTLLSWSTKIQPKLNEIRKSFRKEAFLMSFFFQFWQLSLFIQF